ncbi:MAG: AI-2E family transporter [Dehalococcoidia bacterium]|nr:MAG: AI-2E family transporter [Dehalococcoidia bacterium]
MLKLEISYRAVFALVFAAVALWAFVRLWPVILLVLTAFIFMAALNPYVDWLVRKRLPRTAAVLLLFAVIVGIIAGLAALVVPAMVDEFQNINDNLPQYARDLEDLLANFGINVELEQRARDFDWADLVSGRAAIDYGQRVFAIVVSSVTIIAITIYLLIDTPRLNRFLFQFVPPNQENTVHGILESLGRVVGGYVRGQLITSLIIALYTLVILLILDVPNAMAFAVLAGFADIIPLVGAFIAIGPPAIAAFGDSPTRALIVVALLALYQQFEDRYLVPRVYGSTLNLPPLVVLIAVLAGGELLGVPGILLALPVAAAGRVAFDYYVEHRGGPLAVTTEIFAPDEPAE